MKKHIIILSASLLLAGALIFPSCSDSDGAVDPITLNPEEQLGTYTVKVGLKDEDPKIYSFKKGDIIALDGNLILAGDGKYISSYKVDGHSKEIGSYVTVEGDMQITAITSDYSEVSVDGIEEALQKAAENQSACAIEVTDLANDNVDALMAAIKKYPQIPVILSIAESSPITEISEGTFKGIDNIAQLELPSDLKTIGAGAFGYCTAIKTVKFNTGPLRKSLIKAMESVSMESSAITKITLDGQEVKALIPIDNVAKPGTYKIDGEMLYCIMTQASGCLKCSGIVKGFKAEYTKDDLLTFVVDNNTQIGGYWKESDGTTYPSVGLTSVGDLKAFAIDEQNGIYYVTIGGFYSVSEKCYLICKDGKYTTNKTSVAYGNSLSEALEALNKAAQESAGNSETTEPEPPETGDVTEPENPGEITEQPSEGEDVVLTPEDGSHIAIADGAFKGCASLTTLRITRNIDKVGDEAFADCTALNAVTIDSDAEISTTAFNGCNIKVIYITISDISESTLAYLKTVCSNIIIK